MTIKIYEISHPIIKIISSNINSHINQRQNKYIGLLLAYEIFRSNIKTKKIYIKHTKKIKILNVINNDKNYIILTNVCKTYDIISDIEILIPNIKIVHTNYQNQNTIKNSLNNLIIDSNKSEIFIIEKIIINDEIINLINYLNKEKNIKNHNINIGCIISNENTLQNIGYRSSGLKIYTTKIIYNDN